MRPRLRSALDLTLALLVFAAGVRLLWWNERASGGFNPPGEEDYYNFLVRGWRAGHLYLAKEPRPEMLALPDPYDPRQNAAVRMADASYFAGHYYLYFSPVPAALVMAPWHALTGRELGTTFVLFGFLLTGFGASTAAWLFLRRRFFPASAPGIGALGIVVLGLGTHILVLARRPLVWELPIASAYAFAMLALLGIVLALAARSSRLRLIAFSLAGLSFGLALASRPTEVAGALMFLPALALWRKEEGGARFWRLAGIAALGIGGIGLLVLAHNYARFGHPLEFGVNYQLTSNYEARERHFSLTYVPHNIAIYFFHPLQRTADFPFLAANALRGGPAGYSGGWVEPVAGLLVTFPFLWLVAALPWAGRRRSGAEGAELRAVIGTVALLFLGVAAGLLSFYCATPRYLVDFAPALALLAALGALVWERSASTRGSAALAHTVLYLFAGVTAVVGLALSFDYHDRLLRRLAPDLWREIAGSIPLRGNPGAGR